MTRIIDNLAQVAHSYDALFVDLWGCLHNGVEPFADAVTALQAYRAQGGKVLLLTNSPRPRASVKRQLERIGVPTDTYDEIASSGDAAQMAMAAGVVGRKVYHLGPERDLSFFKGENGPIDVERVPLAEAEGIVCTGLFDDLTETPDDYRLTILDGKNRGLKLLCANPDISVDLGDKRIFCSGAIAQAYTEAGGTSLYFGKPHSPIYQLAYARLAAIATRRIDNDRILCIGDGINTDIRGGVAEDLDTMFITGGLAATEISETNGKPNEAELAEFIKTNKLTPTFTISHLR
ncbi:MAG: TIGR01459 family HAD-type hydrolase [Rhodobacteraceae bacterium]|nr:TIGR01459 family HAD-type hydrolase [Paracoccaceae bacterium]